MSSNELYSIGSNLSLHYRCSNVGLFLPLLNESSWPDGWRAIVYFIGLVYCFFGLAVASDAFMCAIERITSQTVTVKVVNKQLGSAEDFDEDLEEKKASMQESQIWNQTVARLTLIALGNSAPEILLTFIESAEQNFQAGSLGPSTIVGSAAFNAFFVTAVCISTAGQSRIVSQVSLLATTAVISVFAFAWLLIILKLITPDVVEIWEAILTILFFVGLVLLAFAADKSFCMRKVKLPSVVGKWKRGDVKALTDNKEGHPKDVVENNQDDDGLAQDSQTKQTVISPDVTERAASSSRLRTATTRTNGLRWLSLNRDCAKQNPSADKNALSRLTAQKIDASKPHTNNYYRILATREVAAGKRNSVQTISTITKVQPFPREVEVEQQPQNAANDVLKLSVIEFAANKYAVVEKDTNVRIKVLRSGRINKRVLFKYETVDGSAKRGKDYVSRTETLVFNPGETEKFISIEVLPDHEKENDEMFFVKLGLEDFADGRTAIGSNNITQIVIMDTERDTKLQFAQTSLIVKESVGMIRVSVVRRGNTKLRASVNWTTVAETAREGRDFIGGCGQLEFDVGEVEKQIPIVIIDDKDFDKHETFDIGLSDPSEGASLSTKKRKCTVTILNDDNTTLLLTQSDKLVREQLDALQAGAQSWRQQFVCAANVNGGDVENASAADYLLHVIAFMWKLLFAFIPPPSLGGAVPTFLLALTVIGLLTVLLRDLAAVFGCVVGLHDSITAITVVAIGTNIPDLFASRLATRREKTADAAVAHILSNSAVNVFVGLGISWFISAVYWQGRGQPFFFAAGDFSFSIAVYLVLTIAGIALLILRRNLSIFGSAELGGPVLSRFVCSSVLFLFWAIFIALCTLQTYGVLYNNR